MNATVIYDSRNSMVLLEPRRGGGIYRIYDSRNSMVLLETETCVDNSVQSTIVEILWFS